MSRLNREESVEVLSLVFRANRKVITTALGLGRIALKNDKQYVSLDQQLKAGEADVRQAVLASLQKAGIIDQSLSSEEIRHMR